ncbi:MAG: GTPase HflX [Chloroflexi bacterium]|nr:GTPase HflX [Chloroflexota bacterium]
MPNTPHETPEPPNRRVDTDALHPRAFLVGVEKANEHALWSIEDSLEELGQLAETAGVEVVGSLSQKLHAPNPVHYVGKGKLEELRQLKDELEFEVAIFDDELTPAQQRNLERSLQVRVVDRSALILDIFSQRAGSGVGAPWVALAQYEYMLPRLTRQWTHLSRQYGAIGARGGPGETQLEVDRRRVRERIRDVKVEIEEVRRHRALYRDRRAKEGIPVIALVGYTNAGKSTLLNAISGADVLTEDRLFATLDPTTRRVKLPGGRAVLITDTVGFIQKLPHTLVAAFRATLEELESADLLVHVLDIAQPAGYEQGQTVAKVLDELGLGEKPVVTALNKIDLLKSSGGAAVEPSDGPAIQGAPTPEPARSIAELTSLYPNAVAISAASHKNIDLLLDKIEAIVGGAMIDITVVLPYSAGRLAALFREKGTVLEEEYTKQGVRIKGRIAPRFADALQQYATRR